MGSRISMFTKAGGQQVDLVGANKQIGVTVVAHPLQLRQSSELTVGTLNTRREKVKMTLMSPHPDTVLISSTDLWVVKHSTVPYCLPARNSQNWLYPRPSDQLIVELPSFQHTSLCICPVPGSGSHICSELQMENWWCNHALVSMGYYSRIKLLSTNRELVLFAQNGNVFN